MTQTVDYAAACMEVRRRLAAQREQARDDLDVYKAADRTGLLEMMDDVARESGA